MMKKILKILGWTAGILVVLLILLIVGLKLFFPFEKAKQMAIERGREMLGRDIQVGDVDISVWGGLGVKLKDVAIGNPPNMKNEDNFLKAKDIDIKLQILPLLSGEYRLNRLIINEPSILMYKKSNGTNNYTFAESKTESEQTDASDIPPETKAAVAAVSFDKLEINKGTLKYIDDSSKVEARLTGIDLTTALENSRQNMYLSTGQVSVGEIRISGVIPFPTTNIDLRWRAEYDLDEKHLLLKDAKLTIGELNFVLNGNLSHGGNKRNARLTIQSDHLNIVDLLSLLPPEQREALKNLTVDGDLSFNTDIVYDFHKKPKLAYTGSAVVTDLSMVYADIDGELKCNRAQIYFKPDNVRMTIEAGTFNGKPLKGHFIVNNFDDPVINGELGGELDLAFVQPFLPAKDKNKLGGNVKFSVKLSGMINDPTNLDMSGKVNITSGHYSSLLIPEPIESFDLDAYFDNHLLRIKTFTAHSVSGNLSFEGRLTNIISYLLADSTTSTTINPEIDGRLKGQVNLKVLSSYLPLEKQARMAGKVDMDMTFTGKLLQPESIKPHGAIIATGITYSDISLAEPIKQLDADLVLSPDTAWIKNMNVRFVSSDFNLKGSIVRPLPYLLPLDIDRSRLKKPLVLFEMTSHRFNADSLFPEAAPGTTQLTLADSGSVNTAGPGPATATDTLVPLVFPDITGHGSFVIDTLIYSRVEFTDIAGQADISNRKIVCSDVTGKVYSGNIAGSTTIDFNNPSQPVYNGKFQATQIEADDFVRRFTKFGGYVYGKFDFDGQYQAHGWEPEEFINSLTMNGDAVMQNGKMVTSGVIFKAIHALAEKVGESFTEEQRLKNLKTNIIVEDGKVKLDKLTSRLGSLGDFTLEGYYSFDNKVAYSGSIILSKKNTEKLKSKKGILGALSGLLNEKGSDRIRFPLAVDGTIENPKIEIDYSTLTKNIKQNVVDEAGSKLKDLLHKK